MTIEKILVLDFDATCDNKTKWHNQEIIEFPCIILDIKTGTVEDTFHKYIKPVYNQKLTQFCTELTGIQQSTIDSSDIFENVFCQHIEWLRKNNLDPANPHNFIYLTCGDWDLKTALPSQAKLSQIKLPQCFKEWINIKK